jgi:hypothetical protein
MAGGGGGGGAGVGGEGGIKAGGDGGYVAYVWEQWLTEKRYPAIGPCDRCRALDGKLFRKGEGPSTPLHPHCQCSRQFHHLEIVRLNQ